MKLEDRCEVSASPEDAWALLMDVPRIIPCMPGAELVEAVDETHWKAKMSVKLGPVSLVFVVDVERVELDETGRRVVLNANAREARNRGRARARVECALNETQAGVTAIEIVTDLSLMGPVAQYGRGLVQDVSAEMVRSFAANLEAALEPAEAPAPAPPAAAAPAPPAPGPASTPAPAATPAPAPPRPAAAPNQISGLRIARAVLRARLLRLVGWLRGRR